MSVVAAGSPVVSTVTMAEAAAARGVDAQQASSSSPMSPPPPPPPVVAVPPSSSSPPCPLRAQWEVSNVRRMANEYLFPSTLSPSAVPSRDDEEEGARTDAASPQRPLQLYIPPSAVAAIDTRLAEEQAKADWAKHSLDASWGAVEEAMQCNAKRLAFVSKDLPTLLASEYRKVQYWSEDSFRVHFGLTSVLDDIPDASAMEEAHYGGSDGGTRAAFEKKLAESLNATDQRRDCIAKKKGWGMSSNASSSSGAGAPSCPSPTTAVPSPPASSPIPSSSSSHAPSYSQKQVRQQQADRTAMVRQGATRYAPLRRCFTHLLQNKHQYPREMLLLLGAVERVQSLLGSIEGSMERSMLHVPLYKPLQRIALTIVRDLSKVPPGVAVSEAFARDNNELLRTLAVAMRDLMGFYAAEVEEVPAAATSAKGLLGAAMWGTLLTELEARKGLHARSVAFIEATLAAEKDQQEDIRAVVAVCEEEVAAMIAATAAEAEAITVSARNTAVRVADVTEKALAIYTKERKGLEDQIRESSYRVAASAESQEKILRNIRQLYKSLEKEQTTHNSALCEVVACQVNLAKLNATHEQLAVAAAARKAAMERIEEGCRLVESMIGETRSVCQTLTTEMSLHVSRSIASETIRKCTATKVAVDNLIEWRRVTGDLTALYQHIDDEVTLRKTTPMTAPDGSDATTTTTSSSWQLDFLLSNARRIATEKLQFIKQEAALMEDTWALAEERYAGPYEVAMPHRLSVDEDSDVIANRRLLIELEVARKYMRTREVEPMPFAPAEEEKKSVAAGGADEGATPATDSATAKTTATFVRKDYSSPYTSSSPSASVSSASAQKKRYYAEEPHALLAMLSDKGFIKGSNGAAVDDGVYPIAGDAPRVAASPTAPPTAVAGGSDAELPSPSPPAVGTSPPSPSPSVVVSASLRDASLAGRARTILPTLAKFEAELEALRASHKMKNTSDYSKKSDRIYNSLKKGNTSGVGATTATTATTTVSARHHAEDAGIAAVASTREASSTPLTLKLQQRQKELQEKQQQRLGGGGGSSDANSSSKVADALVAAGAAAAMLRSQQRRASQSEEPDVQPPADGDGEGDGEGRESSPPAPPPPPRGFTSFAERSATLLKQSSANGGNGEAVAVPIVPRPPPRRQQEE